jgi:hypothetical protein
LTPFVARYIKKPSEVMKKDTDYQPGKEREFQDVDEWKGRGALTGERFLKLWKHEYYINGPLEEQAALPAEQSSEQRSTSVS